MSNKNDQTKVSQVDEEVKEKVKKKTAKKSESTKNQVPKPKNLTMAKVKREAEATHKMESYDLNDESKIKFYPIFPEGKIINLLEELQEDLITANESGVKVDDKFLINYTCFLAIKYFTSLEKGVSKEFHNKVLQMEHLVDTGFFKQIVNEVFLQTEVHKVLTAVTDEINKKAMLEELFTKANNKLEKLKSRNKNLMEQFDQGITN